MRLLQSHVPTSLYGHLRTYRGDPADFQACVSPANMSQFCVLINALHNFRYATRPMYISPDLVGALSGLAGRDGGVDPRV